MIFDYLKYASVTNMPKKKIEMAQISFHCTVCAACCTEDILTAVVHTDTFSFKVSLQSQIKCKMYS